MAEMASPSIFEVALQDGRVVRRHIDQLQAGYSENPMQLEIPDPEPELQFRPNVIPAEPQSTDNPQHCVPAQTFNRETRTETSSREVVRRNPPRESKIPMKFNDYVLSKK